VIMDHKIIKEILLLICKMRQISEESRIKGSDNEMAVELSDLAFDLTQFVRKQW